MVKQITAASGLNSTEPEALAPEAIAAADPKLHTTTGKKIHWGLTYLGGDWLLNSSFGVAFAYVASRTHWGQKHYTKPVNEFLNKIVEPLIENADTRKKVVGGGTSFLNIMFGGTVVNPLLTHLESHKQKKSISKFFDKLIYGKDRVENDPKFQQAYDAIDHEPKKDSKSAWLARFIALAPLIAASSTPKVNEFFKTTKLPVLGIISHDSISSFTRKTAEKIGIRPQKMMTETGLNTMTGKVTSNWQALHDLIGFDFGYTVYYALLHSAAFSAVAKLFQTNHDKREERKAAQANVPLPAREEIPNATPAAPQTAPTMEQQDAPQTRVNAIAYQARAQATPEQLAQLA
jgi:hypothetical protein